TYDPSMDETTAENLSWLAANPAAYVNNARDQVKGMNWFSSNFVELTFTDYLKFRQNLGLSYTDNHRGFYYDRTTSEGKAPVNGKGGNASDRWQGVTAESIITFNKDFTTNHRLNVMGAFTFESGTWNNESVVATNFPDDMTMNFDMSRALDKATLYSSTGTQRLVSFLGRANYTLFDRYLFTASVRTDGSSKFITKNKWATFLSGSVAWRLGDEQFIRELDFFQNLKLRASYGETGNQGIGAYRTIPQLGTSNYPFNGSLNSGTAMTSDPVSADLRWETTRQYNFGIDVAMWLDGRLRFTVDYYKKMTRDLLQDVVIPGSTGFRQMTVNMGNVKNEGLEITAGFNNILRRTPVVWNISANISWNKSTISGLPGDQFARKLWSSADEVFIQRNGCPIGAIYGYVEDGFYDNEAEVRADPNYANANDATVKSMIGEIKYRDLNNDGQITADKDRTIIGDTNPDFVYGFTNSFSWKNFNLSFMFQGTQGNDIFNGNLCDIKLGNIGNIPQFAYDSRWTPENTENAKWPRSTAGYSRNFKLSNRYVEDGSYLKLKNITVGYDWQNPVKGISSIKFSFTATNIFTISNYSWLDPDVNAFGGDASRRGVDIYSYPSARTYAFGIHLSF
ncbi:MAG: SusC/RagA family TonB-linked outer membrane protein, partial [Paramuribaculum sp.]|nr:SusC/RagA family TonB-linked outer membrane protein [Paramuribaculum sp.]